MKESFSGWFSRVVEGVKSPYALFFVMVVFAIIGMISIMKFWFCLVVISVGVPYVFMNWRSLRQTRVQDWFNPKKWFSVLYSVVMAELFPPHIVEQLVLRMYDDECRKCMAIGKCAHCKCDMSKVYTPWDSCSKHNWGAMIMNKVRYVAHRAIYPATIKVVRPESSGVLYEPSSAQMMEIRNNTERVVTYADMAGNLVEFMTSRLPHDIAIRDKLRDVVFVTRTIRAIWFFLIEVVDKNQIKGVNEFDVEQLRRMAITLGYFDVNRKRPLQVDYSRLYYTAREYLEDVVLPAHPEIGGYSDFKNDALGRMARQIRLFG